jgi:hypothetical protein
MLATLGPIETFHRFFDDWLEIQDWVSKNNSEGYLTGNRWRIYFLARGFRERDATLAWDTLYQSADSDLFPDFDSVGACL